MSILTVSNLSFTYPESERRALDGVSFSIEQGEYVAILGSNGSGKSTLARIICGFLQPGSGEVVIDKKIITGIVFQEPKNQIVSGIVSRDTAFGPENLGCSPAEVEQRTIECLSANGLLDRALSRTNALSLGQTQKLALSGILALHPDVLVLDEATAMLDPESRIELLEFIDYGHRHGQTIIHITHDKDEAERAQKIITLESGKIIFIGSKEQFKHNTEIINTVFGKKLEKVSELKNSELQTDSNKINNNNKSDGKPNSNNEMPVLSAEHIAFSYDDREVYHDFSLSIKAGTLTAITGPSGCGKSTFLELAAGLLIPSKGIIRAKSRPVLAQQESEAALFEPFAADDVAFGPRNQGVKGKELVERVRKSMDEAGVPFKQFADRQTFLLSGGEKRKLSIAGILAMDSDIIMFDEPTAGLDPASRYRIMHSLRNLTRDGKTIVFSTHRMDEADFADRAIAMKDGKIVADTDEKKSSAETESQLVELAPLDGAKMLLSLRNKAAVLGNVSALKKSVIQKMNPVLKYIVFLALFVCSLLANNLYVCLSMLAVSIIYALLAQYPFKKIVISFFKLIPWLLFFCLFQMIFFPREGNEAVYVNLRWFMVTPSKLLVCAKTIIRTVSAFNVICTFVYSTGERELLEGFSGLLKSLSLIHIPVRSLVVIVEIIFRFIPLLIDEASSIIKTQLVRGGLGKAKGMRAKIKLLMPLFIPLVIQTVKRSEALADALTARYF